MKKGQGTLEEVGLSQHLKRNISGVKKVYRVKQDGYPSMRFREPLKPLKPCSKTEKDCSEMSRACSLASQFFDGLDIILGCRD
jgi:hypothetical protein